MFFNHDLFQYSRIYFSLLWTISHKFSSFYIVGWVAVPVGLVFLFISLLYLVMSYKLVKGTENVSPEILVLELFL